MGRTSRTYSKVDECDQIIAELCVKYPDVFWAVKPSSIVMLGVDNVDRSEKAVEKSPLWSKLRNVKGVERAIFAQNDIPVRYIVEVFWSDWNNWRGAIKQAVIANHLLEITPEVDKKNRPDCVGFKILIDALGINWENDKGNTIPNLLAEDVDFDLELRPGLDDVEKDEDVEEAMEELEAEGKLDGDKDESAF